MFKIKELKSHNADQKLTYYIITLIIIVITKNKNNVMGDTDFMNGEGEGGHRFHT